MNARCVSTGLQERTFIIILNVILHSRLCVTSNVFQNPTKWVWQVYMEDSRCGRLNEKCPQTLRCLDACLLLVMLFKVAVLEEVCHWQWLWVIIALPQLLFHSLLWACSWRWSRLPFQVPAAVWTPSCYGFSLGNHKSKEHFLPCFLGCGVLAQRWKRNHFALACKILRTVDPFTFGSFSFHVHSLGRAMSGAW